MSHLPRWMRVPERAIAIAGAEVGLTLNGRQHLQLRDLYNNPTTHPASIFTYQLFLPQIIMQYEYLDFWRC